jgi:type IV pilus assembly protein PilY1
MNTLLNKSLTHGAALLLALLVGPLVIADDTEVYVGTSALTTQIRPNITFIIDTSGSMGNSVLTSGDYDPTVDYISGTSCDDTKLYYRSSSYSPPSCTTSYWIYKTAFHCDSASFALNGTAGSSGFYLDHYARYHNASTDYWTSLSTSYRSQPVECQDDAGNHGSSTVADPTAKPYPARQNNGGPWRADVTNATNLQSAGSSYRFFSANYIAWYNHGRDPTNDVWVPKLDIVKSVFSDLITSMSDVNIALMRFDSDGQGGYFIMPMAKLTHGAGGNDVNYDAAVQALNDGGVTPLSETLYESYLYYKNAPVVYGDSSHPDTNHPDVFSGSNYISPIEDYCQKNFVILLTDGEPVSDTAADGAISALTGASCSGNCLDELAEHMNGADCRGDLPDTQNVITYTIGFDTDQQLLQDTANKGGGEYYTANDTAGLTNAFASILTDILAINTTFIAPAVSVNAFNRFTHRDELYYALFRPGNRPLWNGNVKKFKLTNGEITDATGAPAVDNNTGFFKASATSFWTLGTPDAPDGAEVEMGGAAAQLTLPRKIYTNTGVTTLLTDSSNAFHESNALVTATMLGDAAMSAADRTKVIQWARGVDLEDEDADGIITDARVTLGDPLHSKPVLLTYGGTEAAPDMTLFVGTNAGSLHAFDTDDGSELFSFVPQDLLPNLPVLLTNSGTVDHPYGLDGPLTYWFNDVNNNGLLLDNFGSKETDEHIYLYQGMRRGGRNYYALDVSDRAEPRLLWTIKGGSGDFTELSQSWSAATHAKLKVNGVDTHVLVFGGGYDSAQDSNEKAQDDNEGRAIFIVNAKTGAKIWQAGPPGSAAGGSDPDLVLTEMTNSIPSDVAVIDTNGDGYHDRLYVGDMRAQLWRIDLNNENSGAATLAKDANGDMGGVIAKLGAGPSNKAQDNRRFYSQPDVSLSKYGNSYYVSVGSGYRAHPLDLDIHDSFYMVRDPFTADQVRNRVANNLYITTDGSLGADGIMFDATDNLFTGADDVITASRALLAESKGCYIKLDDRSKTDTFIGEKSLSKSLTFGGEVMFTTYTPTSGIGTTSCSPSQGQARLYSVNVDDCTPTYKREGDSERIDRETQLVRGGIPPEPTIIISDDKITILVGTEDVQKDPPNLINKTYWRQN